MKLSPAIVAAAACGLTAPVFAQSVTLLGRNTAAYAVSADGRTAVGARVDVATAFKWTAENGLYDFGQETGAPSASDAYGVSGNGSTIVGSSSSSGFRWNGPGTFQFFPPLPPPIGAVEATGVSRDGSVVVGWGGNSHGGPEAGFYWSVTGGMHQIPFISARVFGVSGDGSTVVGKTDFDFLRGFTWTPAGGMRFLQSADGVSSTYAYAINVDGSIVVGNSGPTATATIWRNEVPTMLPSPSGWLGGLVPLCVNDNASVVAGYRASGIDDAALWTPSRGTELFTSYLASFGLSFPAGFHPEQITGLSADGSTLVGYGFGPTLQGFVVTIPSPCAAAIIGGGFCFMTRRRRR